jgi:hypothetical protein
MKLHIKFIFFVVIVVAFMVDGLRKLQLIQSAYAGDVEADISKCIKDFEVNMYAVGMLFFLLLFAFFRNYSRKNIIQD